MLFEIFIMTLTFIGLLLAIGKYRFENGYSKYSLKDSNQTNSKVIRNDDLFGIRSSIK